ncbi:MAG: SDR family NAD(P)-dependent oxidoreductase [Elusimicrobia bacterium]|nr:SDR family NAD(P)-dependent oxidoreductase [Elusimicrobiota bacterium]
MNPKQTPLAIIGLSCIFPKADGPKAYWSNIKERVDGITEVPPTHWSLSDYYNQDPKSPDRTYGRRGGFLSPVDFDPTEFGITPNNITATDPAQLLGLVVAQAAMRDAGYGPEKSFDRRKVSVILGVTGTLELAIPLGARLGHPIWRNALKEAGIEGPTADAVVKRISDSYVDWQENSFPGLLGNVVAGRIANRLNLGGTNCVVDAACGSSLSATHMAGMELVSGHADMVVTGGVDTFNDIFMYMCFSKTPALSPTGDSKPFDAKGDGTILGEGIGMVVLKRLADAERDGDRIHAVLKGIGTSSDGRGKAIYAPSSEGQVKALSAAYELSGVSPDTVELVEAHGTGTKVGDAAEVLALTEVYRKARAEGTWAALGSVKSNIGHTKAAAGSAGLIKAVLALKHKVLPPTIKVSEPLAELAAGDIPLYVNTEKRPWLPTAGHPRRAAVSAFGFGGSNFHAVLEEHGAARTGVDWDGSVELVALSGPDEAGLRARLKALEALPWAELRAAAGQSRREFDRTAPCRLAAVVEKGKPVKPDAAFVGTGAPEGGLAFLFPGQGSQYVGMGRDLACQFPEMLDALAAADAALGERLSDRLYPQPAFTPAARDAHEAVLRATDNAQPALGAVSVGAAGVLARFGVKPQMAAGHSYGELTALWAADRLSTPDLFKLSRLRGRLMAAGGGDKGAMLAALAPLAEIEKVLAEEKLDVVLANRNAPEQGVLSGSKEAVAKAARALDARGIRNTMLPVAAAFHSSLVSDAKGPLREGLSPMPLKKGAFPVYANTTAGLYPDGEDAAKDLLSGQLAAPVEFMREVLAMHEAGARTFLEVGSGGRLTGLVKAILKGKDFSSFSVDASNGRGSGTTDLAKALAQLAALGLAVDLKPWEDDGSPAAVPVKKSRAVVPLCGATPVNPKRDVPMPPQPRVASAAQPHAPSYAAPVQAAAAPSAALSITQEGIAALQRLQEQASTLHKQYLESQETAQRTLLALIEQQARGFVGGVPVSMRPPAMPAAPASMPATAHVASSPAPATVRADSSSSKIAETLLAVVSEKTGYPAETLNLDMGLESDLGIDSIKRVEILAALRDRLPQAPVVGPQHVGTLRTLRQIIDFMKAGSTEAGAPPAPVAAPAGLPASKVEGALLAVVSEKTGYPAETLNLDMGLESDLGIDSIKRVEILAALRDRLPEAPVVGPEHVGTLRTLRQIIAFLTSGAAAPAPAPAPASVSSGKVGEALLAVVSEKTGYPAETLNLDMGLESDLGIDSIKRVEILAALRDRLPEAPVVGPEHVGTLRTLREIIAFLSKGAAPVSTVPAAKPLPAAVPIQKAAGTVIERQVLEAVSLADTPRRPAALPAGSELWVLGDGSALPKALIAQLKSLGHKPTAVAFGKPPKAPAQLGGLVVVAPSWSLDGRGLWSADSERWLKDAFQFVRAAAPLLRANPGAVFATVSRLDGAFGLGTLPHDADPLSGALAGLAKTARLEWPELRCKALDCDRAWADSDAAARAVISELSLSGPAEVGLSASGAVGLETRSVAAGAGPLPLGEGDVVVVTGGARGVTAETALALVEAVKPVLVLLGRTEPPAAEPDWLKGLSAEAEIKKAVMKNLNGSKPTPKAIEEAYRRLTANRELAANISRFEAAGAKVLYRAADLRDSASVRSALTGLPGPVRALIHGAGVLADRHIEEKTPELFDSVFDTKVAGLRTLLEAVDPAALKAVVLFSSVSGRYGRVGQSDYAMANEALNKAAQSLSRRLKGARVVSINWGPWEGGMVTPALKKIFEAEGVGLLPLRGGGMHLLAELRATGTETVVTATKLATAVERAVERPVDKEPAKLPVAFERTLDAKTHPFLASHVINGKPVMPLAMMVEWLGHGAMHAHPGLAFCGIDDLRVLKGVILDSGPRAVKACAGKASKDGAVYRVPVELQGADGLVHARGTVLLGRRSDAPAPAALKPQGPYPRSAAEAYGEVLFHGPAFQGIAAVDSCGPDGLTAALKAAPAPSEWIETPLRSSWLADPLALDCALQAAILWAVELHGAPCLPSFLGRYRQFRDFPKSGLRLVLRVTRHSGQSATADADFLDDKGALVARIEGSEHTIDASLAAAFRAPLAA